MDEEIVASSTFYNFHPVYVMPFNLFNVELFSDFLGGKGVDIEYFGHPLVRALLPANNGTFTTYGIYTKNIEWNSRFATATKINWRNKP